MQRFDEKVNLEFFLTVHITPETLIVKWGDKKTKARN